MIAKKKKQAKHKMYNKIKPKIIFKTHHIKDKKTKLLLIKKKNEKKKKKSLFF